MEKHSPVFINLTSKGLEQSRLIIASLGRGESHGLFSRVSGAEHTFKDTVAHIRNLFADGRDIIGLCAAGILIRAVAPLLSEKNIEPAVLAIAEDGSTVVPLIGGHRGANRLAAEIAEILDIAPAITTAGDVRLKIALDDPPHGWSVANPAATKTITANLLAGKTTGLDVQSGNANWLNPEHFSTNHKTPPAVTITHCNTKEDASHLVLHPPVLAVGVGCERNCSPEELIKLADLALDQSGLAKASVGVVVSIDLKADEAALHALADHYRVEARFFSVAELKAETSRLANPSDVVFAEVGCYGVSEGAALAAVGENGSLIVTKVKSQRATCAIALSAPGECLSTPGRKRGKLTIVGIGPGAAAWRTSAVTRVLTHADEIVGYSLYLTLINDLIAGKPCHSSSLSEEEARVRLALERAAEGWDVALVSSGDAGIYALATLAFELLDRENNPEWNRMEIRVEPGVSAIQAAASRMGAPIGHDFCTVSLSDLLTPWEVIEQRLIAAAEGDFIVALYNPVSKRRQNHIITARDTLLEHRPASTPVILGRNLGRKGETLEVLQLDKLTPDRVDMLTLVIIGNSQTRLMERGQKQWVYSPRGYAKKMGEVAS
ncbi:MAG: precorrin-3B C(17)-methyltransferase [Rhodospirillaceae bacterium TMED8]|nr:precorrin-3B C(17)-methyltransferase [Magnetovibrio sp.]OUT47793.1 MAG: precorrin-3B C(17)-methyltransferase [Rhodospirillaceae bacterium TMED8]